MKKTLLVFLLSLFFTLLPIKQVLAQDATNEADSVLQKVKEKVDAVRKNPKVYIGVVTDKTQDSLQIKNTNGKIELVSVNSEVPFTKIDTKETEIKFSDIAIGDFVAAMGIISDNKVLVAKRVLIVGEPQLNRKIIIGSVTEVIKKTIKLDEDITKSSLSLVFPLKWKGPNLKEIKVGSKVVTVVVNATDKNTIRTIDFASK
jgi:hypothetical protein